MTTVIKDLRCAECGTVEAPAASLLISTIPGFAWVGWPCSGCGMYRTNDLSRPAVDFLVGTGGVRLIVAQYPEELDQAHTGARINGADIGRFMALSEWRGDLADVAIEEAAS